ncbi:WD repeat-containing protein 81 isoform X2 [Onthophagus taurus]|uniref:WD repeat-containing protein 81 isoform X2 n=1 Tax=Onthophagus taurus TaxID=166361 RepID=UPI000C1FE120|nr:WD repeat-containing protein 81 isoform X2 [Onthophagus taurus]
MENIFEEVGIPKKYLKSTSREDRFIGLVHRSWLKSLVKHSRLTDFTEKSKFDAWPSSDEDLGQSWMKIFIGVYKKHEVKVMPLPRVRNHNVKDEPPLLFAQLIQYVAQTNYKNLWKESYKKYNLYNENNRESQITLTDYNDVLREILIRTYGCKIINICVPNEISENSKTFHVHSNVLPAVCGVETLNAIFLLHIPFIEHNLNDCVTFSPAILEKCYTKPLFIIYQLLNCLKSLHDRSLTIGDITLSDIYLNDDLWLMIFPQLKSNLYVQDPPIKDFKKSQNSSYDCSKHGHVFENFKCIYCGIKTYDKVQVSNESLEKLCQLWIEGQISNFTYLTALNNLSGRKYGDPNCHHVFPWVSDFSSRCGKNWRDLKKSKYRLNKGDRQLDLMYECSSKETPHHVSDVLSSITYYVYMSRRTPKSVLCKYVRTNWVPAEYPSSIQRLQEWTPDECIPEFFNDPSVFRSIHDDLDDLEVPLWCSGPEDFVEKHRENLEGGHVSERLHHWIDLTFGYKLSGQAAIKAKNVCLQLVDDHSNLTSSGIVQLFTQPHPPKTINNLFWGKIPPKIYIKKSHKYKSRDHSLSSITVETEKSEDELEDDLCDSNVCNWSPLGFTKILSRSRSSLNEEQKENKMSRSPSGQRSASLGPKNPTFMSHVTPQKAKPNQLAVPSSTLNTGIIYLPKEYNPAQLLTNLENKHGFYSKTFHSEKSRKIILPENKIGQDFFGDDTIQNAFTNRIFTEAFEGKRKNSKKSYSFPIYDQPQRNKGDLIENFKVMCNYLEIISSRRTKELQILGCLIIEIFMNKQIRTLKSTDLNRRVTNRGLNERLKTCISILRSSNDIPFCIRYIANLLLQPDQVNLKEFKYPVVTDVGLPPPSAHLLLEPLNSSIPFTPKYLILYGLLKNIKNFENVSQELSVLYHFDCDGFLCTEYETIERTKVLFEQNIGECKVKACAKNMEFLLNNLNTSTEIDLIYILVPYIKTMIEYPPTSVLAAWYLFDPISQVLGPQKSSEIFLESMLKLYENEPSENTIPYNSKIAKLYHHTFLMRLIIRFGLKRFLDNFVTSLVEAVGRYRDYDKVDFILHTHEKIIRKTSHLKTIDAEELSPGDESSESEKNISIKKEVEVVVTEPEVFEFEQEGEEPLKSLIEHLELNVAEEVYEENFDDLNNAQKLASPTIPIPSSSQLGNISCEIGSKKSFEFDESTSYSEPSTSYDSNYLLKRQTTRNDLKISDASADSLMWLSHRLGPVLSARYLSRNLLKMLTLCYVGKDNLMPLEKNENGSLFNENFDLNVGNSNVIGDRNASKVLDCLGRIAALYGEQFILLQYFPHMSELIALCKRKLTLNLEGGLISCLSLLKHVIPYLADSTLMEHLDDDILKSILHPCVRLLGSTKYAFPNGSISRNVLARKFIDTLYILSLRMGADNTRTKLAVPSLQRFFMIFEKIKEDGYFNTIRIRNKNFAKDNLIDTLEETYIELRRDGSFTEWTVKPGEIVQKIRETDSPDSISPPTETNKSQNETTIDQAMDELKSVFTSELAHTAYIPFLKQIGLESLEISLKNHSTVHALCQKYVEDEKITTPETNNPTIKIENQGPTPIKANQSRTNVALIGNRIDLQTTSEDISSFRNPDIIQNTSRHLRGNWLAYWEHEIGRHDKDTMFNFKQIKLQNFTGHTHSVKSLCVLDNENSFLSGSKDKAVKLWSLRSQGDGSNICNCQWTYTSHRKSILAITFVEANRLIASCDGTVHIWDPFVGQLIEVLENPRSPPVNTIKAMPVPSTQIYAATTEGMLRIIDVRTCSYTHDLKVNVNQGNLIRCIAVSKSGLWFAAGQSSGHITVLDSRTGQILATWRAHESEVLQLVTPDDETLISSSLDQNVSIWNVADGKFKFSMKGTTEPVHCLNLYNSELISGTTANRIGVYTSIDVDASFSSTKLRSDAFKGILTSMAVLPLNRLLLLGADNGNITLVC